MSAARPAAREERGDRPRPSADSPGGHGSTDSPDGGAHRHRRPSGVREVIGFNWPLYAAGALAAGGGWALARRLPPPAARLVRAGAVTAGWLLAAGTAATWCVYDRSELHGYAWLDDLLPDGPGRHLVVSAGLDEASRPVAARHPDAPQRTADLYDPALMTEGSIRRARRRVPPEPGGLPARPGALPAATTSLDSVLAVFSAHELRRAADRAALFAEAARVLRPDGTFVVVEHLRDAANLAVYGPGAWHFLPRAAWLGHAAAAGLRPVAERRIAGLVTAFAFRRAAG
ncbi:class I SAM-dependent methyltransferase [Kitasatospora sp. NPDC059327]|uniref:class I SAM-dependent methyltransferase n=1 Tax=Kitasatospora sp. NPDC059327 TaxID=3346803 RepID=UPI003675236B